MRSTADAIEQCFKSLARRCSAQYILEGDIHSCFDTISHKWLLENTPMDKEILGKWPAAGYIEDGKLSPTTVGAPQGGIISPTLLTITLSGLEQMVKAITKPQDKINVCIYADDFIITGATAEVLENKVRPAVDAFLRNRGLSLSQEKTKITHINDGFDFLGVNIRKHRNKLIVKPAKSSVKRLLADIREKIKSNRTAKTDNLIRLLNPMVRGWGNYYRNVCSKMTFSYVDHYIFEALWRWAVRRHPNKKFTWIKQKYFRTDKIHNWIFSTVVRNKYRESVYLDLVEMKKVPIKRHIKIKSAATPYNPEYHNYLEKRIVGRVIESNNKRRPSWWLCWWNLIGAH